MDVESAPLVSLFPPKTRWGVRRRALIVALVCSLVASLVFGLPSPAAAVAANSAVLPGVASVPVSPVVARVDETPSPVDAAAVRSAPVVVWPSGGVADLPVPAEGAGLAATVTTSVGGLPVGVHPAASIEVSSGGGVAPDSDAVPAGTAVSSVRVEVAGRDAAVAAGVSGVLFSLSRADGSSTAGVVGLDVSYALFREAFGGDFASRLRLVSLPGCALTDPGTPACQVQTLVPGGSNALSTWTVSAGDVAVGPAGSGLARVLSGQRREWADASAVDESTATVFAVAAAPESAAGSWKATPLSPSASWASGSSGGEFSWSYPLKMPPGLGGPAPDLTIRYSSGSVDGRTGATNAQPSWIGEGFDLGLPFVERSYLSCADDGHAGSGDLCWSGANAVSLTLGGRSTGLAVDPTSGAIRPVDDDQGLRIDHGFNAPNGTAGGEYWVASTPQGVRHFFGSDRVEQGNTVDTGSALRVPVFGDDPGEDCYSATFSAAYCKKGWRWNLDYVVDQAGNSMTLFYAKQSNYYAINGVGREDYDRAALLDHIDYGTRAGLESTGSAPMNVVAFRAHRCLQDTGCFGGATPQLYPDTPFDQNCGSTGGCANTSPTFWSHERLSSLVTRVWDPVASAYVAVSSFNLAQEYPSPGDDTSSMLYLRSITPYGWDVPTSTWVAGPVTRFDSLGSLYANRVDFNTADGVPPMMKWRVNSILNGVGGQTLVGYSGADCVVGVSIPEGNANNNTKRCFPQWTVNGTSSGFGWFHKYVATSVTDRDLTGAAPDV